MVILCDVSAVVGYIVSCLSLVIALVSLIISVFSLKESNKTGRMAIRDHYFEIFVSLFTSMEDVLRRSLNEKVHLEVLLSIDDEIYQDFLLAQNLAIVHGNEHLREQFISTTEQSWAGKLCDCSEYIKQTLHSPHSRNDIQKCRKNVADLIDELSAMIKEYS